MPSAPLLPQESSGCPFASACGVMLGRRGPGIEQGQRQGGERTLGRLRQLLAHIGIILVLECDDRQRQARSAVIGLGGDHGLGIFAGRLEIARGGGIEEGHGEQRRHCRDHPKACAVIMRRLADDHARWPQSAPTDRSRRPGTPCRRLSERACVCGWRGAAGQAVRRSRADKRRILLLHIRIIGTAAPFGRDPGDVLRRILDVACFAVNAILGVDLEAAARLRRPPRRRPPGSSAAPAPHIPANSPKWEWPDRAAPDAPADPLHGWYWRETRWTAGRRLNDRQAWDIGFWA